MCEINRRGAGVIFCFISAFLFATRYTSASIFGSSLTSLNKELFNSMLQFTGNTLITLSIISLVVGIIYLVLAEIEIKK
ncbi:MAG: hypothetical protein ACREVX_14525 [Clostridium sp.]|uniref:hypothetical protein n=1 Tax=Clostridium sp. TaxID=1506 RepID=UPI003D6CD360